MITVLFYFFIFYIVILSYWHQWKKATSDSICYRFSINHMLLLLVKYFTRSYPCFFYMQYVLRMLITLVFISSFCIILIHLFIYIFPCCSCFFKTCILLTESTHDNPRFGRNLSLLLQASSSSMKRSFSINWYIGGKIWHCSLIFFTLLATLFSRVFIPCLVNCDNFCCSYTTLYIYAAFPAYHK